MFHVFYPCLVFFLSLSLSLSVSLFLSPFTHLDLKMQQPPKRHSLRARPSNDAVGAGLPLPAIRGAPNSPKQSRGSWRTLEAIFLPASSCPTSLLLRTACHMLPAACLVFFSLQHGDVHPSLSAASKLQAWSPEGDVYHGD